MTSGRSETRASRPPGNEGLEMKPGDWHGTRMEMDVKEEAAKEVREPVPERETRVAEILSGLKPTPASYAATARALGALEDSGLSALRLVILATDTVDLVVPYLVVEAAQRGLLLDIQVAPFGQLEQQALDPTSALHTFAPDVVVIAARIESLSPSLTAGFLGLDRTGVAAEVAAVASRLEGIVDGVLEHGTGKVLLFDQLLEQEPAAGFADSRLEASQRTAMADLNARLAESCRERPGTFLFDYSGLVGRVGRDRWRDDRLWYLGRIPFSADAQRELGAALARHLRALTTPPRKCLVLDLDNTIWGGVIGEDGLDGIKLGESYPGNVFKAFQRYVLDLRARGILLAVASKNNPEDALEALGHHDDCLLRPEVFAALEISWDDKVSALRRIAAELNIGVDSLVFFDDNPVERAWVADLLPEVLVVDVPKDPMGYIAALDASGAFDLTALSHEDRRRAEMYTQDKARQVAVTEQPHSIEEFLESLQMKAIVGVVDADSIGRVAQLLSRTNQFNLTTRRHTATDVEKMIASGAICLYLRIEDRFGDLGLIGAALCVPSALDGAWVIDTLLLSCRVIGRRVEDLLLAVLAERVRAAGGRTLIGEYLPTRKNRQVAELYPSRGFQEIASEENRWELALDDNSLPRPAGIEVMTK